MKLCETVILQKSKQMLKS